MDFACLSVFSGAGMLDVGFSLACEHLGIRARTLGYCEREAYAAACLLARMEDASLEPAPIWCGSIEDLPRDCYRGRVDCLVGGFPCQDISFAGNGAGIHGARSGLWFEMLALACDLGAQWLALENVAAITARGLDSVLGSLADCGFDAEWLTLRASDVGASHRRDRWFCLAHRTGERCGEARGGESRRDVPTDDWWQSQRIGVPFGTQRSGPSREDAVFAPGPDADWGAIVADHPHLAPATEPGVRRVADGISYVVDPARADQLRVIGNGVVPLQAAVAFVELFQRVISRPAAVGL